MFVCSFSTITYYILLRYVEAFSLMFHPPTLIAPDLSISAF